MPVSASVAAHRRAGRVSDMSPSPVRLVARARDGAPGPPRPECRKSAGRPGPFDAAQASPTSPTSARASAIPSAPHPRHEPIKSAADPGRTCARSRPPQNGHGPRHSTPARFQPAATAADSIWVQVSIGVHLLGMLSATPRLWPSRCAGLVRGGTSTDRPPVHTVREGSPVDANLSNRCTLSASVGSHPRVGHSMMYSSESRRRGPATSGPGRARRHPVTRARSPRKEQGPHRCVRANSAATAEALPRRTRVRRRCSESGSARPVLFNDGDMPPLTRFKGREPSRPARATGPAARRACRASRG